MKKISAILLFSALCTALSAGPASPGLHKYTQPDGSVVNYYLHGDEHLNWMTDESGNVVEAGPDGYLRSATLTTGVRKAAAARRSAKSASPRRSGRQTGERTFMVILVQYPDLAFKKSVANFEDFFNGNGAGSTASVQDYYIDQSDGKFIPKFDIYGPVTLANNRATYKSDPDVALSEALNILVNDGTLNLNDYISSQDGIWKYVQDVIMIFAGHSRAAGDNNGIWPCSSDAKIMSKGSTLDVIGYCCGPELEGSSGTTMAGIGHICHEFGHRMGLPDFYDTNKSEHGSNVAVSCEEYSLMDHGSYNNNGKTPPPLSILEKSICGWASINDIPEISSSGSIELHEIGQDPSRTRALAIPTDQAGEIFICEYRTTASSVNKWNAGLSRGGLLVYHVDLSDREITQDGESYPAADWWDKGTINNNGGHPLFYLIPSGAQNSLRNTDMAKVPFPGSQNIIKYRPVSWNNTVAYVSLSGISYNSSMASNPTLTFNANVRQFPLINNPKDGIYSSGSELTLKLSPGSNDSETVSQWFFDGQEVVSSEPRPKVALTAGGHVVEALLSSGKKLRLDITAK